MKLHWLVALSLLVASQLHALSPRDTLVVDAAWLAQHLSDPDLVVLHVGEEARYKAGHIPGARLVSQQDISISHHSGNGLMLEMPPSDDLRKDLEKLGISDRSRVVVYFGKDWVSPATRILFTLDYAGLGERSMLLNGGLEAWTRNGGAVTKAVPALKATSLSPLKTRPIIVDAARVLASRNSPGVAVVDGRASSFYDGADTGESHDGKQRTGHIAGAHSVPFTSITDDNLMLRTPSELESIFLKAGVRPGDTIIGYCHIGQQATAMLFAARTLGHPVFLYDGSFEDWSRHASYPVDNPSARASK